ncbi:hypothetical protein [Halobacteriovorax sp.]|uniref:hypothetical protein n=1 Tax=Halobacteriovorax sp. TaxID=2020862 RepID=UPI003561717D
MIKSKKLLLLILPAILCVVLFYPLFLNDKLFQDITPLQVAYSEADYFFTKFSLIYSLNSLGEPLLTNPTNGILSLQAINYLIFDIPLAYKLNFVFGFLIFYYFSYKFLIKRTTTVISSLLPLVFLAAPIFLSTTQRLSFWSTIWIPVFLYIFTEAIEKNSKLRYLISGLVLSRTFSMGDPLLFILLPTLSYLLIRSRPKKEALLGVLTFLLGIFPFLYYYLEHQPLMARYYGQPEHVALTYSLLPTRIIELFTNGLFSPKSGSYWFKSVSLGLVLSLISGYTIYKSPRKISIPIIIIIITTLLLSLGIYFYLSELALTLTPFLNQLRFPEKFTIYVYVSLLCLTYFQSHILKDLKYIHLLLAIAIIESVLLVPDFKYIDQDIITQKNHLKTYQNVQTRFKICPNGLGEYTHRNIPNLRAFGVATLNSTSNISSTALKMISCKNIIINENAIRLGVSHLLIMNISSDEKTLLDKLNWIHEKNEGPYHIYRHETASPLKAIVTNSITTEKFLTYKGRDYQKNKDIRWDKNILDSTFSLRNGKVVKNNNPPKVSNCVENKIVDIKTSYHSQKFKISTDSRCGGLLLIPWYFSPGWKAYSGENQLPIYRINDISMGVQMATGAQTIEFLYLPNKWPLFFTYFLLTLLIASAILLKLRKNKMS